jgi:hypothetical protein
VAAALNPTQNYLWHFHRPTFRHPESLVLAASTSAVQRTPQGLGQQNGLQPLPDFFPKSRFLLIHPEGGRIAAIA